MCGMSGNKLGAYQSIPCCALSEFIPFDTSANILLNRWEADEIKLKITSE